MLRDRNQGTQRTKRRVEKEGRRNGLFAVRHFKKTDQVLFCHFSISYIISDLISVISSSLWSSVTPALPQIY